MYGYILAIFAIVIFAALAFLFVRSSKRSRKRGGTMGIEKGTSYKEPAREQPNVEQQAR